MNSTAEDDLDFTLEQLKTELEAIGVRGVRSIGSEPLHWLQHTQQSLAAMGAEFLASKIERFIDSLEPTNERKPAEHFLDLLTTIRVFQRTLTIESVQAAMQAALQEPTSPDHP